MKFRFADNKKLQTLDKVPEEFRPLYEEGTDGGYVLKQSAYGIANSIDGLNKALGAAREEAKRGRMDLSPLADYGEDPESIAEAFDAKLKDLQKRIKGGEDAQKTIERMRAEMTEAHQTELAKKDKRVAAYRSNLHKQLVDNAALQAIAAEKGSELLLPFIKQQVQVQEESFRDDSGEEQIRFKTMVMDDQGMPRHSFVTGQPTSIRELVKEMKSADKYAPLFQSDAPNGGGAEPTGRPSGQPMPGKRADRNSKEKIAAGLASRGRGQRKWGAGAPQGVQGDH